MSVTKYQRTLLNLAEERMSQLQRGEGLTNGKGNVAREQKPAVLADL
jgi:hypothetical protein